jgi:ABC-type uncharacterized transport system substrate-binding protein
MKKVRYLPLLLATMLFLGTARPGAAHPHVLVEGRAEVIFDAEKNITAVRNTWIFDEAYSSFATLGLDADGDGALSQSELLPLAKVNVESLHEFAYFTFLKVGQEVLSFQTPSHYTLTSDGKRLELDFILPLIRSVSVKGGATLEIHDPQYFVAFAVRDAAAFKLVNAPGGCTGTFHPPSPLDARTMSLLSEIPAEQRELPDDLQSTAASLANRLVMECRE